MSKHPENKAFVLKMQLAFAVWKRGDLSPAMRLIFTVLLIGHHNVETGKCNPSYETLASETGMTRHGVIRIIGNLEAIGLLAIKASVGRKHTNAFRFPSLEMVAGQPPIKGKEMVAGRREMVAGQPRNGGRSATQNIKEHKEHSEASPLPLDSEASASPKANGKQWEEHEMKEKEANAAKLDQVSAALKAMGVKPTLNRMPYRPDKPRHVASEAELRMYARLARGEDIGETAVSAPLVGGGAVIGAATVANGKAQQ
jgi:hypothetical protein